MLWSSLCFLGGLWLPPAAAGLALQATTILCLALACSLRLGRRRGATAALLMAVTISGWSLTTARQAPRSEFLTDAPAGEARLLLDRPVLATAMVTRRCRPRHDAMLTEVRLQEVRRGRVLRPASDRVAVYSTAALDMLSEGDMVTAWLVLRLPAGRGGPGEERGGLTASLKSLLLVESVRRRPRGPARVLAATRGFLLRRLHQGLALGGADPRHRALAAALFLGETDGVSAADKEGLRRAGLAHVLAISGLHIAALFAGAGIILRRAGVHPVPAALLLSTLLIAYIILLPLRPSVGRAAIMGGLLPVARCLGRRTDPLNLLGGAALLFLVSTPELRHDPGFLLSFIVTASLLIGSAAARRSWWRQAWNASWAATLSSMPLTACFFGQAAPGAVILNLAAVPLASILVVLAASATLLAAVHPALASVLAAPLGLACQGLEAVASLEYLMPYLQLRTPRGRAWLVLVALGLLALMQSSAPGRRRRAWLALAMGSQLLVLSPWFPSLPLPAKRLSMRALDVGQGDALLIGLPRGGAILVDGGGRRNAAHDRGLSTVLPALADAGITRLRAVVLTHPHDDHGGGLVAILNEMPTEELWLPAIPPGDLLVARIVDAAMAAGVAVRTPARGESIARGGALFTCLHPPPWRSRAEPNRQSLVFEIAGPGGCILLTGDIDAKGESEVLSSGLLRRCAVLKVAHHGSHTSTHSPFLRRAAPRVAVVSAGRSNPWNHPHPELLQRLTDSRCRILRTDRHGTVTAALSGGTVEVTVERAPTP